MANSLGRSLTGCVVLIRADVLKPEYADPETRKFRVQGGFGAVDFTSGTQMYGTWVATGEEDSVRGYHVEAVIEEAESAEMNKVYMDPTTNEWVGEYETRDGDEISRQTEWFATESEARRFTRTGKRHTKDVTVYHNSQEDEHGRHVGMLDGYLHGHVLVPVARYTEDCILDVHACELAFHLFNVGDDPTFGTPDERAIEYRRRGNRSLSKGDVVCIQEDGDTRWYACADEWELLPEEPIVMVGHNGHGTTSLKGSELS